MKVKILHLTTAFFLMGGTLLCISAKAQREGLSPGELQDPTHLEYNLNDDKPLLTEHDSKSKGPIRDSIAAHNRSVSTGTASPKPKSTEHSKSVNSKEEDDALSFNFLYYIIQKFKISDLIDE
jgi:hypothetical protein